MSNTKAEYRTLVDLLSFRYFQLRQKKNKNEQMDGLLICAFELVLIQPLMFCLKGDVIRLCTVHSSLNKKR